MNKYQSNIRTYMARNLIWNSGTGPITLYPMNAPNSLVTVAGDMVFQFYRSYGTSGVDWSIYNNVNIKRFGLYSNFADGLVMANRDSRFLLSLRTADFYISQVTGTAVFTKGSQFITGTNLHVAYAAGAGFKGFIADGDTIFGANYYAVYDVAANGLSARISDFAYANATPTKIDKLLYTNLKIYETARIPVLNTMFDTEVFFANSVSRSATTICPLILAIINIADGANLTLYTKTVDTNFNTFPVSFDGMLEAEITPA